MQSPSRAIRSKDYRAALTSVAWARSHQTPAYTSRLWSRDIARRAVWLFTSQLSLQYSLRLLTEGWPGWVDLGYAFVYLTFLHLQFPRFL